MGQDGELIWGEICEGVRGRHGGIMGRWVEPRTPGPVRFLRAYGLSPGWAKRWSAQK